jgi:hypothetical protein
VVLLRYSPAALPPAPGGRGHFDHPQQETCAMKRFLLITIPGLLPLWVAIAYVLAKGMGPDVAPAYWDEAPDLILYAMPASVVTLLVVLALIDFVERRRAR